MLSNMESLVSIGEAASALGVAITTLRRWEASGKLIADHTAGGHRRYDLAKLKPELLRAEADAPRRTVAYARVSSHDQKDDLEWQKQVLELYCARQGWTFEVIDGPKAHRALLNRLQRLSRSLSRKQKGSCNRKKAKAKLAKLHARIAALRSDALHKLTTDLAGRFHTIGIEDLNVRGMVKNRHLARSIADMGFFEVRRQLEYKAAMRGGVVVVADRVFASSKTCSACGYKLETFPCPCAREGARPAACSTTAT
jgi:IS605 OrfB family transposase